MEFKREFDCRIYAYCLMTNHVHLIVNPRDRSEHEIKLIRDAFQRG
ncbi:MAG: transposase [Pseudomonadota bacterium]